MTRNAMITKIWASTKMVSMTSLAVWPSGSSGIAVSLEANAHQVSPNGKTPVLICAPR